MKRSKMKGIIEGIIALVVIGLFLGLLLYVPDTIQGMYYNYKIRKVLKNKIPSADIERIVALKNNFKKICTGFGSVCIEKSYDWLDCKGKLDAIVKQKKKILQKYKIREDINNKLAWICTGKNQMIHRGF